MMGDDRLPDEPTVTMLMRTIRMGGMLVSYGYPEGGCRFSPYVFQSRNLRMRGSVNDMEVNVLTNPEEQIKVILKWRNRI